MKAIKQTVRKYYKRYQCFPNLTSDVSVYGTATMENIGSGNAYTYTVGYSLGYQNTSSVFKFAFNSDYYIPANAILSFSLTSSNSKDGNNTPYACTGCKVDVTYTDDTTETLYYNNFLITPTLTQTAITATAKTEPTSKVVKKLQVTNYYSVPVSNYFVDCGYFTLYYLVESTASDYDVYEDVDVYKVPTKTVRKYYKYQYSSWTQPTLTADGDWTTSEFAVKSTPTAFATYYCWYAFNSAGTSGPGTGWAVQGNSGTYFMHSKTAICITNIMFTNRNESSTRAMTSGTVYGSNDGSTWTQLTTFTNSVTSALQTWNVSLSGNTTYYNYYKIYGANSDSYTGIGRLTLTATQRTVIDGTAEDYDFYEDVAVGRAIDIATPTYTLSWIYDGDMTSFGRWAIVTINGTDYAYAEGTTSIEIPQGSTVVLSLSATSGSTVRTIVKYSTNTDILANDISSATFTMTEDLSFHAYVTID